MVPYASIIIPTHDRACTLPYSVRSALAQSVPDIEVIIVGDGATPQVKEVAATFAKLDRRVKFLDLPKAPLRGAANRDIAVRRAVAERVFYSDDDDLLLPTHVEILGATLDNADIVDTPPVSVQINGSVSLGLHDSAHPSIRQMLIDEVHKGVFDTHLAHRKSAYLRGTGAWTAALDRRVVLHTLKHFAVRSDICWKSVQRITALSFHGACRFNMPDDERVQELMRWEEQIHRTDIEQRLRNAGSYTFHSFWLYYALQQTGYLAAGDIVQDLLGTLRRQTLVSTEQRNAVRAVRDLIHGKRPDETAALSVFSDLIDARLGPEFSAAYVVGLYMRVFPPTTMSRFLEQCETSAAIALARFHFRLNTGAIDGTEMEAANAAMNTARPWARFFVGLSIVEGLSTAGRFDEAWEWTEAMMDIAVKSHHARNFWRLRKILAAKEGCDAEANRAETQLQRIEKMSN